MLDFFFFNWQMRKEINECEVRVTSTLQSQFSRVQFRAFFSSFFWVLTGLAIVESSLCNLRPLDHSTISFYSSSHSHQLDLSIMVYADCCFCVFLSALFPMALSAFFFSLPAFCFWLCIPESSGLLTLLCVSPTKYLLSTTLF